MVELNSALGALDTEKKEEDLDALMNQLAQYPDALGDYRMWLRDQGISTEGMPMGSAESTMSVFSNRLKNGRAWSDIGMHSFICFMVSLMDGLEIKIKTLVGTMKKHLTETESDKKKPRHYREKLTKSAGQATRQSIAYLAQSNRKPIYEALKGLQGV